MNAVVFNVAIGLCMRSAFLQALGSKFVLSFCLLGLSIATYAQSPNSLNLDFWASGNVQAISVAADYSVYAAGIFSSAEGEPRQGLIKIQSDGNLDGSFHASVEGVVVTLRSVANGDLLIGGDFTGVNQSVSSRVARLDAVGNLITNWAVSVDNTVLAIHPQEEAVYIGGQFTTINEYQQAVLARVSLADGSLDSTFLPTINGAVADVAVDHVGNVWVGGLFDEVNGQSTRNLVVLDSQGVVLRTFDSDGIVRRIVFGGAGEAYVCGGFARIENQERSSAARFTLEPSIVLDSWGIDTDGDFFDCTFGSGGLWVAGDMSEVNGSERRGVAKIDVDGVLNSAFQASTGGIYSGTPGNSSRVISIEESPSGVVWLGGLFTEINEHPVAALAAVDAGSGDLIRGYELERPAEIRYAVSPLSDGSRVVGGFFRRAGKTIVNNLARVTADGEIDQDWPLSSDGLVNTSLMLPDGSLIIGGFFSEIGDDQRFGLARLSDPISGVLDESWRPAVFGTVRSLHIDSCSMTTLYVGGLFSLELEGSTLDRANFAKFDLEGSGDPDKFGLWFDDQVNAIAQPDCDRLLVGGLFNEVNGVLRRGLAVVEIADVSSVDPNFDAELNGSVWSLMRDHGDESVYVGGSFTRVLGQNRNRIARLGSTLSNWNPGTNGIPTDMAMDSSGGLYVVGNFTQFGGVERLRIAKTSAAHPIVVEPSFNPGSDGPVLWSVQVLDDQLMVTGNFTRIGGHYRRAIASFEIGDGIFTDRFEHSGARVGVGRVSHNVVCRGGLDVLYGPLSIDKRFRDPPCVDD